ncbi:MAG: 16S rRNA (guanine(527)-N(7))-methyltransferase RsmG [Mycoplasmatota bacterium]
MNKNEFIEELKIIGIEVLNIQLEQLEIYYDMLIEYNKVMNLTGITEKEQVYLKHFYDSSTLCKIIDFNDYNSLCDVGTGAGFPGIVIKILFPKLNITLVDSLNKRIKFLNDVIEKLNLEKIECVHSRIEDYAKNNRNKFDLVTARAVAPLNVLLEYCIPVLKETGFFIPMKANMNEEMDNAIKATKKINCDIIETQNFQLPIEKSNRTLIKIRKIKDNKNYPRENKEIKKNPL